MAALDLKWLTISAASGTGTQTLDISALEHSGRVVRSKKINVTPSEGAVKSFTVQQAAEKENVSLSDSSKSIEKAASSLILSGVSNSSKLTFEWVSELVRLGSPESEEQGFKTAWCKMHRSGSTTEYLVGGTIDGETVKEIELPDSYTVTPGDGSGTIDPINGQAIGGDPGASDEYSFKITIPIPVNTVSYDVYRILKVTDSAGNTAQCTIIQTAGDTAVYLSDSNGNDLAGGTLTYTSDNISDTFKITSNGSWIVSGE